jgi:putative tryptophan/tyrosine transport system substrate-binding protein
MGTDACLIARRRLTGAMGVSWLLATHRVAAQKPAARMVRIGMLAAATPEGFATRWAALREGLRELGYVEGRNVAFEWRYSEGKNERLPALAAELVRSGVDLIVTHGIPGTQAAKGATSTIPIVMATATDPVAAGLVASFSRPGGNVTGNALFAPELSAKRLDLVKELLPRATTVGALVNPGNPQFSRAMLDAMTGAAPRLGLRVQAFEARGPSEFAAAFDAMVIERVDAVAVTEEAVLNSYARQIAAEARRVRLPTFGNKEFAEAGGLIGYGADIIKLVKRAAPTIHRILNGANPGEIAIEQASTFELLINQDTARAIDMALPRAMIVRADRVIE